MILPPVRDPRLVTTRRGGSLTDEDHRLLALWAAACAEHVLGLFETARPGDPRPRQAIEAARAWAGGQMRMTDARLLGQRVYRPPTERMVRSQNGRTARPDRTRKFRHPVVSRRGLSTIRARHCRALS